MEHDSRLDGSGSPSGPPAERVTRHIITAIGVVFCLYGVCSWLGGQPSGPEILLAAVLLVAFLVPYSAVIWAFAHRGELVYAAVAAVAMTALLGDSYSWLAIPVSGLAVLYLPASRGVPAAALTTGATAAVLVRDRQPGGLVATYVLSAVLYTAIYYLVGVLSEHSRDMVRTRGELAREAVAEERLRFSRELHDILGHSLSVISAKTELAMRLVDRDPEAAWGEVSSLGDISRRSIADVRRVVRGYRMSSLTAEIATAQAVLAAGDVHVVADEVPAGLPSRAEEAFCWVVRAAVTNILQHARARFCFLEFSLDGDWARMRVTNDGVHGVKGDIVENEGNGLPGLRLLLAKADGTLTHGRPSAETFSIEAAVPLNSRGEITCPSKPPDPSSSSELSSPRTKS